MTERTELWDVTGYGSYDNDPPGYDIANPNARHTPATRQSTSTCWGVSYEGLGTYEYPAPFAADVRVIPQGTVIYVPHVQRYFEMVDWCQACRDATDQHTDRRLDLYVGGDLNPTTAKVNAVNSAANSITRLKADGTGPVAVIFDPDPGHPVPSTNTISGVGSGCNKQFGPARVAPAPPPPSSTEQEIMKMSFAVYGFGGNPWVRDDSLLSFQDGAIRVCGSGWPAAQVIQAVQAGRAHRIEIEFLDPKGWLKVTDKLGTVSFGLETDVTGLRAMTVTPTTPEVSVWLGYSGDGAVRARNLAIYAL